ncbi:MAG: hypothetical protein ACLRRA_07300 [Acutalibacteraceae bacterium]
MSRKQHLESEQQKHLRNCRNDAIAANVGSGMSRNIAGDGESI